MFSTLTKGTVFSARVLGFMVFPLDNWGQPIKA